jgi:hypothetical protein
MSQDFLVQRSDVQQIQKPRYSPPSLSLLPHQKFMYIAFHQLDRYLDVSSCKKTCIGHSMNLLRTRIFSLTSTYHDAQLLALSHAPQPFLRNLV